MTLRYGSVCSGIEAATAAWHPLGWKPQFFSEIDAAPRAVLQHRYPEVPLHGDFTTIEGSTYGAIDLLVGGTPCQSFSVAGLRGGLADDRGNLALQYLRLADRTRPRWLVWENVPGVLSSNGGRDFGAILGGMVELGYGVAYRVLDAQYVRVDGFGRAVPQRRRRVFVVGCLGDWRRAAAVLFERACLSGHPAPRREAGQRVADASGISAAISSGQGWWDASDVGATIRAQDSVTKADTLLAAPFAPAISASNPYGDHESREGLLVAHSLRGEGFDASEDVTGRGTPIVPVAYGGNDTRGPINVATAVNAHGGPCGRMDFESETFIALQGRGSNLDIGGDVAGTLGTNADRASGGAPCIAFDCKAGGSTGFAIGDIPGALRGEGAGGGHAAIAAPYTLAVRGRGDGHQLEYRQDGTANAILTPNGGRAGIGVGAIATEWAVRRLTPLECERLQGFPEIQNKLTVIVCGEESSANVFSAERNFPLQRPEPSGPVAVNVRINLERSAVEIRRAGRLIWSASTVAAASSSPLSMPLDAFVRLAAHTITTAVQQTEAGRAGSPPSTSSSSDRWNGSASVSASGREIAGLAKSADQFTETVSRCMKSITSQSGHSSPTSEPSLQTSFSCVVAAIASCIPEATNAANSYAVVLELTHGYTAVPYRNGIMSDGPRYKMLGNSMAVNVMRWIGRRIEAVEALSLPLTNREAA